MTDLPLTTTQNTNLQTLSIISLVAWKVSHCHTVNEREKYVAEMAEIIPVGIYGKCNHNRLEKAGYNNT